MNPTPDPTPQNADILIIGGGLSGSMLAVQLLRLPGQRRILIVEPRSELGRGEAYSATELGHTLNGNAARMRVPPHNADDLPQWLPDSIAPGGRPAAHAHHLDGRPQLARSLEFEQLARLLGAAQQLPPRPFGAGIPAG